MLGIAAGIFPGQFNWVWPGFDSTEFQNYSEEVDVVRWTWSWAGIRLGRSIEPPSDTDGYYVIDIFYPWIVVPLTLLSAYLLLSKPRPAKKPEPSVPMGDVADCQ